MNNDTYNKSLHWIFTPLRSITTSEFNRSPDKINKTLMCAHIGCTFLP